jgi:S-ribosylhomocysteine lyase
MIIFHQGSTFLWHLLYYIGGVIKKQVKANSLAFLHGLKYDKNISKKEKIMEKITSFTIDHIRQQPGVYVSRKDHIGQETITTFDLRFTSPNEEPVMNTAEVHTIEHLAATFLRNEPNWKDRVIYFGPMGCRTGFYLILAGDLQSDDIVPLLKDCFGFAAEFSGEIPGASAKDCGNYMDMNLPMANHWAKRYLELLNNITPNRMIYPQ